MAAKVVALDRSDDLSGVSLSLQLPGDVDGPSAGGVVCLAIMSALDGRSFPKDCAMTGTVMPDGTIGRVGGIPAKMRAAAAAGAKRIILPAFLRFEREAKTGEDIDLKELARSLKMELLPVQNITGAYAAAQGFSMPRDPTADLSVLALPEATESFLKRAYKESIAKGVALWNAIPDEEKALIQKEPLSRQLLVDERAKAESAFASGRLLYAASNAEVWLLVLRARQENDAMVKRLPTGNPKVLMEALDTSLRSILGEIPEPKSLLVGLQKQLPDIGLQLSAEVLPFYGLLHVVRSLGQACTEAMKDADPIDSSDASAREANSERVRTLQSNALLTKVFQILLARCVASTASGSLRYDVGLTATLTPQSPGGSPPDVERLLYSAFRAADNSLFAGVIADYATTAKVTKEQCESVLLAADDTFASYSEVRGLLGSLQPDSREEGQDKVLICAAHVYARAYATVSGLIFRWTDLDATINEEQKLRYGRTDLLNHLLSSARQNALQAIAGCKDRGIPCIAAIDSFETAELERDDADTDKVTVLSNYWNASLQAKVLRMLFGGPR